MGQFDVNTANYNCPQHGKVTKGHLKTCPAARKAGCKKNGGKRKEKRKNYREFN